MFNYVVSGAAVSSFEKLINSAKDNIQFILISLCMMVGVYLLALVCEKLIEKSTGVKFSSRKTKVNKLVVMAMFSALAVIIMYFEFPLPFIAPGFYELDLSEIPILIGSFMYGPVAGVVMEGVKILLKLCLKGTSTAFVGDFANFVIGCCIVVPASVVYHTKRNKKRAIIGLIVGGVTLVVAGAFMNGLYLLPKYSQLYGVPIEAFISQGTEITPAISDITTFVMLAVVPFNIIKVLIVCTVTGLMYKHVSRMLKLQG